MIEALSANASDESFREWIWPGTLRRCEHLLNAHSMNPSSEIAALNSVTVPYQISRHSIFWERFDNLLRGPFCRGMLRHIEMQDAATLMRQHDEYEQHAQLQRGTVKKSMETN